jgi:flagellar secretion chaperone FliS
MNAVAGRAVDTYTRLEVETGVAAASPQKLVVMLYEGAIKAVLSAQAALARGDLAERGAAISKAISIIDEGLRPALDLEAGGDIAANLMALYDYVSTRLLYANLKAHAQSLDEVTHLLTELKSAWETLERQSHPVPSPERIEATPAGPRPALSYGKA